MKRLTSDHKLDAFEAYHIVNFVCYEKEKYLCAPAIDKYLQHIAHSTLWHRPKDVISVLGKQSYIWNGNGKNWIWEREFETSGQIRHWRIWSSSTGTTFEVEPFVGVPHDDPKSQQLVTDAIESLLHTWNTGLVTDPKWGMQKESKHDTINT